MEGTKCKEIPSLKEKQVDKARRAFFLFLKGIESWKKGWAYLEGRGINYIMYVMYKGSTKGVLRRGTHTCM